MGLNIILGLELFYPNVNGLVNTKMNLSKNFQEMGHNPIMLAPKVEKNPPPIIDGIPIHYIPSTPSLVYPGVRLVNHKSSLFDKIVKEHNTDIIHTIAPWCMALGLHRVGKKNNIPILNTFHTNLHDTHYVQYIMPFVLMNKFILYLYQTAIWRATRPYLNPSDMLSSPSPVTCAELRHHYPKKRVEWVPNGVETDLFRTDKPELLREILPEATEKDLKYAIFVGRFGKEKSIDELIRAVKIVIQKIPDFKLIIVGYGPKSKQLQQLTHNLDLTSNIQFVGKVEYQVLITSGLLKKARFFTTASTTETHSMSVTEALCCGVPIVAADHPSMTYLANECGYYFKQHNVESISNAFIDMWTNEEIYQPRKQNATKMLDTFDGVAAAKKYLSLYQEIIEERKSK